MQSSDLDTPCYIALGINQKFFTDENSTLVQVLALCTRQQAITRTNDVLNLYRHMASLCHSVFKIKY